jgi:hypothetical protein
VGMNKLNGYSLIPLRDTLKQIFIPSGEQAILSLLAASLTFFAVFFNYFFKIVTSDPLSTTYLEEAATGYVKRLDTVPLADQSVSIIIWGLIGVLTYFFTVIVVNLIVSIAQSLNLVKGSKKGFDSLVAFDTFRRLLWVFLAIAGLAMTFSSILPWAISRFKNALLESAILDMLLSVIILSVAYYLTFMFVWVAVRNPHILSRK